MTAFLARKRHLLLVLLLAGFHMLVWERGLAGDGWGYFSTLESMIEDRDFDLTNNRYAVTNGIGFHEKTQRWVAQYPPGLAIFDAPMYMLGAFAYDRGWVRPAIPPEKMRAAYKEVDSRTLARIAFVVLSHNLYALLAIILIDVTLLRLGFSEGEAAFATALAFFGSQLHFYAQNGMAHAVSTCMSAGTAAILAGICGRPEGRAGRWYCLGLAVGAGAIIRYPGVLFSLPAALALLVLHRKSWAALIGRGLLFSAGLFSLLWILPVYLQLQLGDPFASTYTPHWHFDPTNPPLFNVLLNPRHGFFWFHPLFLLAVGAMVAAAVKGDRARPERRLFAGAGLLALAALATLHGYWFSWWGDSYSQRYVTEAIPFLAPGVAIFLAGGRRAWRAALALALTAVSYGFFLLSNAALVYDVMEGGPGQYLSDYRIILDQQMTLAQIGRRLAHASFTLPILQRHAALVGAGIALAALGYAALGRVERRSRGFPAERAAGGPA
jgi:hypothetical protein